MIFYLEIDKEYNKNSYTLIQHIIIRILYLKIEFLILNSVDS
jgi:hypothetical protein